MNLPQILDIEAKAAKASPGPRRHIPGDTYCAYPAVEISTGSKRYLVVEDHSDHQCKGTHSDCDSGFPTGEADMAFIASANPETITQLARMARAYLEVRAGLEECQNIFEDGVINQGGMVAYRAAIKSWGGRALTRADEILGGRNV